MTAEIERYGPNEDLLDWMASFIHDSRVPLRRDEYVDAFRSRREERRRVLERQHYERVAELDPGVFVSKPHFIQIGVQGPSVPLTEDEEAEFADEPVLGPEGILGPFRPRPGPDVQVKNFGAMDYNDTSLPMGDRMRAWMTQKGTEAVMEGMGLTAPQKSPKEILEERARAKRAKTDEELARGELDG